MVEAIITLLGLAAKAEPAIEEWLADVTHGKTDAISVRVRDVLPEGSASRAAQRALEA